MSEKTKSKGFEISRKIVYACSGANVRNDSASILPLSDGRLLLAWSEYTGGSSGDVAPCRISGIVSADEGRTWSERFVIQEGHEGGSVYSASLLRMADGDIAVFYMYSNRVNDDHSAEEDVHVRFKRSRDDGRTWAESERISDQKEATVLHHNDRAVMIAGSRIVVPVTIVRLRPGYPNYECVMVYYSDDHGRTWKTSRGEVSTPGDLRGSCEPCIVELRGGRLLMFLRDASGVLSKSYSVDGAETWSIPVPTDLPAHNSPMLVKRIPETNDLCLVWNQADEQQVRWGYSRARLTAAVSKDEGETWPLRKNLVSALDDRTRLDPPAKLFYKAACDQADRSADDKKPKLEDRGTREKPVYSHSSYPSLLFYQGRMFATYDACGAVYPKDATRGLVLHITPYTWLYE